MGTTTATVHSTDPLKLVRTDGEASAQPEARRSCDKTTNGKRHLNNHSACSSSCKVSEEGCMENPGPALLTRRLSSLMPSSGSNCGHGNKLMGSFRYGKLSLIAQRSIMTIIYIAR